MLFYDTLTEFVREEKIKLDALLLSNIPRRGVITKVLAPHENKGRRTHFTNYSVTHEREFLNIDVGGILGERHYGAHCLSTGREKAIYPRGINIAEQRHIFAVSLYDCSILSARVGVKITPELLGANLVIEREDGMDYSLSALPRGTYLVIAPEKSLELSRPRWRHSFITRNNEDVKLLAQPLQCTINVRVS